MRIREGDPLEIFTDKDGEVIFKKYSPIGELGNFATQYAEILAKISGHAVCITDRDVIIAVSGVPKKEILERKVSSDVENFLRDRTAYELKHPEDKKYTFAENIDKYSISILTPIISDSDVIGSVIFFGSEKPEVMSDIELKLSQSAASFLGKQMEE